MQSSHAATAVDVAFDDPNLIADVGLVPVVALAEQVGLPELIAEHVSIVGGANSAGANPVAKVMSLVAGMVAGADSIADVDRLRYAGMPVTTWCSSRSVLLRPWGRSCGRSPTGTCSS